MVICMKKVLLHQWLVGSSYKGVFLWAYKTKIRSKFHSIRSSGGQVYYENLKKHQNNATF